MSDSLTNFGSGGAPARALADEGGAEPSMKRSEASCIRENLRRLRLDRELTQAQLGAKAGVSRATVGRLERALVAPKTPTLDALATALGVSLGDLVLPVRPLRGVRFCEAPLDPGGRSRGSSR